MTVVFVTHSVFESVFLSQPHRGDERRGRAASSASLRSMRPIRATHNFRTSSEYAGLLPASRLQALAQASAALREQPA